MGFVGFVGFLVVFGVAALLLRPVFLLVVVGMFLVVMVSPRLLTIDNPTSRQRLEPWLKKISGKSHADWWNNLLFYILFMELQVAVKLLD